MAGGGVSTVKLPGLENRNWKVTLCPPRKVPDGLWDVPFTSLLCVQTNLLITLIKPYDRSKTFDNVYLFCKSADLDPKYQLLADENAHYKLTVYTDWSNAALQEIVDDQRDCIEQFKDYQDKLKVWRRYESVHDVKQLTPEELIALEEMCYCPPTCEYKQMPQALVVLDDMAYSPAFALHNKVFSNWMVLHRHYLTSAIISLQMFKSNLSRSLRNNLSNICLWSQKSLQLQREIADEFSNLVTPDQFIRMWQYATRDSLHDFFNVDMYARDRARMFRKNLNEALDPAQFQGDKDKDKGDTGDKGKEDREEDKGKGK